MDIQKIDKNFAVQEAGDELRYYDAMCGAFTLHGVIKTSYGYARMEPEAACSVSHMTELLARNTSGGRLRFVTDSLQIAIHAVIPSFFMPHMSFVASCGMDVCIEEDGELRSFVFMPVFSKSEEYRSCIKFEEKKLRKITLSFPLYNGVKELSVGLERESYISPDYPYKYQAPVLFYGSSITQGACAGRPSTSFPALLSKRLNCDFINMGFSGNAKGELSMAEYLAQMDSSALVMEYDYNADSPAQLRKTHAAFFARIRELRPSLPVLFLSRPNYRGTADHDERRAIVKDTYCKALAAGDGNVWWIDGKDFYSSVNFDDCSVDSVHPNDLGMYLIAERICPVLREMLDKARG